MKRRLGWLLAWGVLTLLVVAAFRALEWEEALSVLRGADSRWLLLAVSANFLILPLGAYQWIRFLPTGIHISFRRMFWILSLTSTVSNTGPFLTGHAAGIHLLSTRGGAGWAAAVSVKALDQLATGVVKLTLLGTVLLLVPLPTPLRATALTLLVGVPLLAAGLLLAAYRAHTLEQWAARSSGWWSKTLGFIARVASHLDAIRRPGAIWSGVLLAFMRRAAEGLAIWSVTAAVGVPVPLWGILLVLTAVNLSTMASVTPGNLGIYEASALLAYRMAGVDPAVALGLAVLQHVVYMVPLAGVGWLLLAWERLRPGSVSQEGGEQFPGGP